MKFSLHLSLLFCAVLLQHAAYGQKKHKAPVATVTATKASDRLASGKQNTQMRLESPLSKLPATNLGPTVMSGRVVDIAVDPKNEHHFYVAYATGGLWETHNNGASFTPIFDQQDVIGIGAIAVDWTSQRVWVGTGESNSSRSSYSGLGVYLGTRKGDSYEWRHMGLADSHHIGRIVLHPNQPQTAFVAVIGHLYTPNQERGIYITRDGGATWTHALAIDAHTGCIDIDINPKDPNELFAAAWTRNRRAWNFEEAGAGSGIYHSIDGGITWKPMPSIGSTEAKYNGRIGIAFAHSTTEKFLYAFLDNQTPKKKDVTALTGLKKEDFLLMNKEQFMDLANDSLQLFIDQNNLQHLGSSSSLKADVQGGKFMPRALYDYLFEPTAAFYEKEIIGAEVYRYDFNAQQWKKTHEDPLEDVVYSYGYYFGMIEVNPSDPAQIYIAGVPLITSNNGGKTWQGINPVNVHADHHALWINPNRPGHLINGSDGGLQISYDNGTTWVNCNAPSVAQCYAVAVEQTEDYQVYCGLQDNGVWVGPSNYQYSREWHQTGHYPYHQIMGGDGMQIAIDPRDNNRVFTGYQFGQYAIVNQQGQSIEYVHPTHALGETPLRWNWQTPILISSHQPDVMYICSNKVHRSTDGGKTFKTLSEDLTRNTQFGDVSFGTLTSISESTSHMGHLVVGSDDGLVHVSLDNGYHWTNITNALGKWLNDDHVGLWVSRVLFSRHHPQRIYVALNGYRDDFFAPLAFYTDDLGKTWSSLSQNIPMAEAINVIKEDPVEPNLIYIGTDHGLYVHDLRSNTSIALSAALPGAAVHDLAIHELSSTLVIGTHGRGMYAMNLHWVRHYYEERENLSLAPIAPVAHASRGNYWSKWFDNSIELLTIPVFSKDYVKLVQVEICTLDSLPIARAASRDFDAGLTLLKYDLSMSESEKNQWQTVAAEDDKKAIPTEPAKDGRYYLPPNKYLVKLSWGGFETYRSFEVTE